MPVESGVKFRISREVGEHGICLLIKIDHETDPIFAEGEWRPDYLAVYLHGRGCLCTIIEMKGKGGEDNKHGLEQIQALAERMKQEFTTHLPRRFQLDIQGILLSATGAQTPVPRIKEMEKQGLTILSLKCDTRAELFPYISKRNRVGEAFQNQRRHPTSFGLIEGLLATQALHIRMPDVLTQAQDADGTRSGLHIQYVLPGGNEYVTLLTRGKNCVFALRESAGDFADTLRRDLESSGLQHKFFVEEFGENT